MLSRQQIIDDTDRCSVHNYDRLPLVADKAKGVWIWDVDGKKYLDFLGVYASVIGGHNNSRIIATISEHFKYHGVSSMSGGYYSVPYGKFVEAITRFCGMDRVILKSGGSEAFEVAIKIAKRWGYRRKNISYNSAEIIGCRDNFHGRLPNALGLSTHDEYQEDFGPFPAGLRTVDFGNAEALYRAISPNTVAFVVEPIQGEGGVNIPSKGYLLEVRKICNDRNVLLIFDEIQTGFGRTGYDFAHNHEGIKPDMLIIAKALGAGLMPVSAVLANNDIMGLIGPGDEGSTFGSHPLSCVAGLELLKLYKEEKLAERSRELGEYFLNKLKEIKSPDIKQVRGRGLFIGIELKPNTTGAKNYRRELFNQELICETAGYNTVVRFSPPLIISKEEIDLGLEIIKKVFEKPKKVANGQNV